jgi:16S rRNA (uracil1498-N3)-methyltransferase
MSSPRVYQNIPLSTGHEIVLDDNVIQHVVNVLRLKPDAELRLFNGDGYEYTALLTSQGKRKFGAAIQEKQPGAPESSCQITLGQAISRGEKMDYAIQKAVELGVFAIQPVVTTRIAVKLSAEILAKRQQHWQSIVISACEQSGRCVVPQVYMPISLENWLPQCSQVLKLVLDPVAEQSLATLATKPPSVAVLIGPEGGFTSQEIQQAHHHDFLAMRLGPRILRTETATVCALSLLQYLWGDLS